MRASWVTELADVGLNPPQAAVVRALREDPGCSLRSLSRRLGTDPMTAKRCADELEQRGLVSSAHRGGGDRRPRSLELTPAGSEVASRVGALAARRENAVVDALGDRRAAALADALGELETFLGLPLGGLTDGDHESCSESQSNTSGHRSDPPRTRPEASRRSAKEPR